MPTVIDNRAYVQGYLLCLHVDSNRRQVTGCLRVFKELHPHSPSDSRVLGLSYPSHPLTKGNWIRWNEYAYAYGCN